MEQVSRLSSALAALSLRSADRVGKRPTVAGRPHVSNEGSILIGDDLHLGCRPVRSHLIAGPGAVIEIGHRVHISFGAAISSQRAVRIGDDTSIGPYAVIMDGDFHRVGDRQAAGEVEPIHIGKGVCIGARVTILRGSHIGDGARISSGSMVSGPIAAGAVVGGVPARAAGEKGLTDLDLPDLVMRVLGLAERPELRDGPDEIPQWDSLGTLRLLLAVEETFEVALGEEEMKSARSVAELAEIVGGARAKKTELESAGL